MTKTKTVKKSKRGKYKYTPEQRLKLVLGYRDSGLPLRVYARKHKIPAETLRCWVIGKYKVSPVVKDDSSKKKKNAKK